MSKYRYRVHQGGGLQAEGHMDDLERCNAMGIHQFNVYAQDGPTKLVISEYLPGHCRWRQLITMEKLV